MSISEVTTAASWLVGVAVVALLATGWRKPARAQAIASRRGMRSQLQGRTTLHETSGVPYRPAPWWRRVWSVVWSGTLAVWVGAVIATLVGFGVAKAVITFTDMLKR